MLLIEISLQQLSLDLESLLYSVGECQAELLPGSAAAGLPEKYTLDSEFQTKLLSATGHNDDFSFVAK